MATFEALISTYGGGKDPATRAAAHEHFDKAIDALSPDDRDLVLRDMLHAIEFARELRRAIP